jgi:CRP/FNR family transcriptional regulator, cyclic AMP receptor protein
MSDRRTSNRGTGDRRRARDTERTFRAQLMRGVFELKGLPLFEGMNAEQLLPVADAAKHISAEASAVLFRQGDEGRDLYVLLKGEAVATRGGRELTCYGPGELVGELAFLEESRHPVSVHLRTKAELIHFARDDFRELCDLFPALAQNVIRVLSIRLRQGLDCR